MLGSLTNSQTLNRYAYVGNDPLNFTDPTGHFRLDVPSKFENGGELGSNPYEDAIAWQNVEYTIAAADAAAANASSKAGEAVDGTSGKAGAEQIQPCTVQAPTDQNDRAMLAGIIGEAAYPGTPSWSRDPVGPKAYKNPTGTLAEWEVEGSMGYMVAVVNNRLLDWGKTEHYSSWKDFLEKTKDFKGYQNGKNNLNNLGAEGNGLCNQARLAMSVIRDFHTSPFGHDPARPIYHYWRASAQRSPRTGRMYVTAIGDGYRIANTDFSVNLNRY